ncbi:16133_t:CDS:2, partial [Cetraspora pellucida]
KELENKLYTALKSKTKVNNLSEKLQNKYSKQKLHTYVLELIDETKQLKIENNNFTSENIYNDLSLAKSKTENVTKSKKIKIT